MSRAKAFSTVTLCMLFACGGADKGNETAVPDIEGDEAGECPTLS